MRSERSLKRRCNKPDCVDKSIDALNSPQKVLATIMERPNAFADNIKKRPDVRLIHLKREKFDDRYQEVLN
jgi:hypothetical protein